VGASHTLDATGLLVPDKRPCSKIRLNIWGFLDGSWASDLQQPNVFSSNGVQ
jgi:hypothetical protein